MTSFPSLAFGAFAGALDFGAHRVLVSWAERAFPRLRAHHRALVAACAVLAIAPFTSRQILLHARSSFTELVFACCFFELMVVLAASVPLLVLLFATRRGPTGTPTPTPVAEPVTRREVALRIGGASILGATGAVFGWGTTFGRHDYEITEVPVRIPGLPKELDGYTIAQISDIHVGAFVGERELADARDLVRRIKPDLCVATGDLVDVDPRLAPMLARALADLPSRDGTFTILGNHDYYAGHEEVSSALRAAGVTLLMNDARIVRPNEGGGFALVGLDDAWSQPYGGPGPKFARATASLATATPRILLAHQPNQFHGYAGKVALQLSGHTHGGQIRPANLLLGLRGYVAGRYELAGSTLYVNRGFGVAGPPARIGVPPEITRIILVAA